MLKNTCLLVIQVAFALSCAMLVGCGTKGPLYIPEQRYPQAATAKPNSTSKVESTTSSDTQHTDQ